MRALRKVIKGVAYDTEQAELVASETTLDENDDAEEIVHALYWSNEGRWFRVTYREEAASGEIAPLTRDGAVGWCREYGVSTDVIVRYCGTGQRAEPAPESWTLLTSKWTTKEIGH